MKRLNWCKGTPAQDAVGVYIIFNIWHVEYVGQGVLKDRIAEWDDDSWWTLVPSEAERLGMERYLIGLLEPRQNKTQGADVENVSVYPPEVPLTTGAAERLAEEVLVTNPRRTAT